jgi:hypothetical protein
MISQEDKKIAQEMLAHVKAVAPLMQVRNASASPAGRKIQARVVWPENGKTIIGYASVHVPYHEPGKPVPPLPTLTPRAMLDQVCRLYDRAQLAVAAVPAVVSNQSVSNWQRPSDITNWIGTRLDADTALLTSLQPLCDEIHKRMKAVYQASGHHSTKRQHAKKRALITLRDTLDHVLKAGVSDDEIKEMLQEAMVRATMES